MRRITGVVETGEVSKYCQSRGIIYPALPPLPCPFLLQFYFASKASRTDAKQLEMIGEVLTLF